ncbi:MAG: putative lipid II flippase FtsW [Clostridia bacterium]|nr:putative lipid II flippase FtsW [Clostridia bacterium]
MPFLFLVLTILTIGLIMLFSSSYAYALANEGNSFHYVGRQMIWAIAGTAIMLLVSFFDYHKLRKATVWILLLSYILLVVVLITPTRSTAHRWLYFPGGSFQPSELTKFAIVLTFAHFMTRYQKQMGSFKTGIIPYAIIAATTGLLLLKEPHLSCTMIVMALTMVMLLIGGVQMRWILMAAAFLGVVLFVILGTDLIPYAGARVGVWKDPFGYPDADASHQTRQSLYAIGSGGLFGLGLGNSRQKYLYLPEPQNDFIFAVVCEELGLVGALLIILLFCALVWRGITIARRAEDRFGAMLATGLTAQVGIQAFLNIAVVSSLIPNTGISLPFFSYGGTSLVMLMAEMGLVLSISRNARMDKA